MSYMQRNGTAPCVKQDDCACTECTARRGKQPTLAPVGEQSMQVDGEGEGGGVQVVEVESEGNCLPAFILYGVNGRRQIEPLSKRERIQGVSDMRNAVQYYSTEDASLEETRAAEEMKVKVYRKVMARGNEKRDEVGLERDEPPARLRCAVPPPAP